METQSETEIVRPFENIDSFQSQESLKIYDEFLQYRNEINQYKLDHGYSEYRYQDRYNPELKIINDELISFIQLHKS